MTFKLYYKFNSFLCYLLCFITLPYISLNQGNHFYCLFQSSRELKNYSLGKFWFEFCPRQNNLRAIQELNFLKPRLQGPAKSCCRAPVFHKQSLPPAGIPEGFQEVILHPAGDSWLSCLGAGPACLTELSSFSGIFKCAVAFYHSIKIALPTA